MQKRTGCDSSVNVSIARPPCVLDNKIIGQTTGGFKFQIFLVSLLPRLLI
jgi:hypothetical protein